MIRTLSVVISVMFVLLLPMCVFAQAQQSNVSVQYSLRDATLHEPLLVELSIRNDSGDVLMFDLGLNKKSRFVLAVESPDGHVVGGLKLRSGGLGALEPQALEPGGIYRQRLILNEWFEFTQVGLYRIQIDLQASFLSPQGKALASPAPQIIEVNIGARSEAILLQTCARLAEAAVDSTTPVDQDTSLLALTFVSDPIAVPYLGQLLSELKWADSMIIPALGRIANAEARSLLQRAAQSANGVTAMLASQALAKLAQ